MANGSRRWLLRTSVLLLSGLASAAAQPPAAAQPSPVASAHTDPDIPAYRVTAGDVLDIRFYYNEELNTKAQVRPDGRVSLPLLGELEVANLSVGEFSERLRLAYGGIVRNPAITVQIEGFANRRVFVGGEVAKPGIIALTGYHTVLSAIYEAGGLTRGAQRSAVTVIRRTLLGTPEMISVSLKEVATAQPPVKAPSPASGFALQPLDVVVVYESGISKANRAVDQYVRQMIPLLLTGGFQYVFNPFSTVFP
jgi:polysaccharide biosynthesis/export protein